MVSDSVRPILALLFTEGRLDVGLLRGVLPNAEVNKLAEAVVVSDSVRPILALLFTEGRLDVGLLGGVLPNAEVNKLAEAVVVSDSVRPILALLFIEGPLDVGLLGGVLPNAEVNRLTEAVVVSDSIGAGTEDVGAAADEEEVTFPGVWTDELTEEALEIVACDRKGQWLTSEGHLETVETSVTDTTTSTDEVGATLPLDAADSELPLVEVDVEEFAVCTKDAVWVVDTGAVDTA